MFDTKRFMKASFIPRTEKVELAALKEWFSDLRKDEVPTWEVRGLTGSEMAICNEASKTNTSIDNVIKAITTNTDKIEEIRKAVGINTGEVPAEIIKRLQQLVTASVDPIVDHELAVKMAETYPVEFYILTNKIVILTGLGLDLAK